LVDVDLLSKFTQNLRNLNFLVHVVSGPIQFGQKMMLNFFNALKHTDKHEITTKLNKALLWDFRSFAFRRYFYIEAHELPLAIESYANGVLERALSTLQLKFYRFYSVVISGIGIEGEDERLGVLFCPYEVDNQLYFASPIEIITVSTTRVQETRIVSRRIVFSDVDVMDVAAGGEKVHPAFKLKLSSKGKECEKKQGVDPGQGGGQGGGPAQGGGPGRGQGGGPGQGSGRGQGDGQSGGRGPGKFITQKQIDARLAKIRGEGDQDVEP